MSKKPFEFLSVAIISATALAVASGLVALFSAIHVANHFSYVVRENLPALRAAEELEIALLGQRGLVSCYMIDGGNPRWLEQLRTREGIFGHWLAEARKTALTDQERALLRQIEQIYSRYSQSRNEAIDLYDRGYVREAYMMFLYDLSPAYDEVHSLCEDLVVANVRLADAAGARAQERIGWVTGLIFACVGLTAILGGAALWFLDRRIRAERANRSHEAQLLAARRIQEHLLPDKVPDLSGFDIASAWYPAEFAAGDYFDYFHFPDGSLGVVIADVSGHGVGPALLTASTRAYLRSLAETRTDLAEILTVANSILAREIGDGRFVTLILGRIDPESMTFTYVNAGHPSGYVFDRSGHVRASLKSTSLPLGLMADAEFILGDPVGLCPGETLVLVTDGILEARSGLGEVFGEDRMLDVVRREVSRSAADITELLYRAVCEFCQTAELADDFTAMVIKMDNRLSC